AALRAGGRRVRAPGIGPVPRRGRARGAELRPLGDRRDPRDPGLVHPSAPAAAQRQLPAREGVALKAAASLLLLAASGAASAALLPPASTADLPRLVAVDDREAAHELVASGTPTLLLPVFTRCTGTCPMTAAWLREGLKAGHPPFRV